MDQATNPEIEAPQPSLKELLITDEARGLLTIPEKRMVIELRPPPNLD